MLIKPKNLDDALHAARVITEQYFMVCPQPHDPERSIEWLHLTVERHLGVKIRLLELHLDKTPETTVFGACVMKADKNFDVCYVRGLNTCWRRYVICKELFHALIDRPEYRDMDISSHVGAVTVSFPDDESKPNNATSAEFLAEVGAMEFLFPISEREKILAAGKVDALEVATRFRVPRVHVELYLSDNFMGNLKASAVRIATV